MQQNGIKALHCTEMRSYKKLVSLDSPVFREIFKPISFNRLLSEVLKTPRVCLLLLLLLLQLLDRNVAFLADMLHFFTVFKFSISLGVPLPLPLPLPLPSGRTACCPALRP